MVSDGVVVSVVVDVVVVVVEVVDAVVVVGYETFVSKKLVTWSSTSTNSHVLKRPITFLKLSNSSEQLTGSNV